MILLFLTLLFIYTGFLTTTVVCQTISNFEDSLDKNNANSANLTTIEVNANATQNSNITDVSQDALDIESLGKLVIRKQKTTN